MKPHYTDPDVTLYHGDCLAVLREIPDCSVDAVVTDPPYGLGFMGREWDNAAALNSRPPSADETDERFAQKYPRTGKGPAATAFDGHAFQSWCESWATECLRVLKPGGHMLAFGGSRTWHRLAAAVEDAGFEIRDSIAWLSGSGFPKSLDVSKAIDRAAGAEREVVALGPVVTPSDGGLLKQRAGSFDGTRDLTAPATDDARTWAGWGTALKPAFEPIVVGRKPLIGTVSQNVLAHGVGALNVDGCRVGTGDVLGRTNNDRSKGSAATFLISEGRGGTFDRSDTAGGRWPANVVLDDTQAAELDRQSGTLHSQDPATRYRASDPSWSPSGTARGEHGSRTQVTGGDSGGASRFFPVFPSENSGIGGHAWRSLSMGLGSCTCGEFVGSDLGFMRHVGVTDRALPTFRYEAKAPTAERPRDGATAHPTVKPLDLMRWLVRLVTPPGGTVLEPFAGSGTTAEACVLEGMKCIAIEREADYLPLIVQRLSKPLQVGFDFEEPA